MKCKKADDEIKIPFIVKSSIEKSFNMVIRYDQEEELSLQDLFEQAQDKFDLLSEEDYELVLLGTYDYDIKDLDLEKTLAFYEDLWPFYVDIKEREMINKAPCATFVKITDKNCIVEGKFSNTANQWRTMHYGLNIFGKCENEECVAKGKEVIFPIGFNKFDLILEEENVKCPMCNQYFEPVTCGFTGCYYKFNGIMKEKGKPPKVIKETEYVEVKKNGYKYYDPRKTQKITWSQLKIICKPLNTDQNLISGNNCFACGLPFENKSENTKKLICGHLYHEKCLQMLKTSSTIPDINTCIHCVS